MKIIFRGEHINLKTQDRYTHNRAQRAITGTSGRGEPYATFTKCIEGAELGENETIIDTNNLPDAMGALSHHGLIEDTGRTVKSGYCEYPIVKILV